MWKVYCPGQDFLSPKGLNKDVEELGSFQNISSQKSLKLLQRDKQLHKIPCPSFLKQTMNLTANQEAGWREPEASICLRWLSCLEEAVYFFVEGR